ncbi:hypothetical protein Tdes44962_MAKER00370 [Teratosphaeria destructans]|uniref:Uncharacterized protein n=1 Tax=Teratosphaeria destructans TaxID=418781 RepID=A0A9W7SRX1_9PEZI|nr:hypothetical protein Tdes44962_MAKER00370 [Teratosphaeria destructans]
MLLINHFSHHHRKPSTVSLPSSRLSMPAGSPSIAEHSQYAASTQAMNITPKLMNGDNRWTVINMAV